MKTISHTFKQLVIIISVQAWCPCACD